MVLTLVVRAFSIGLSNHPRHGPYTLVKPSHYTLAKHNQIDGDYPDYLVVNVGLVM